MARFFKLMLAFLGGMVGLLLIIIILIATLVNPNDFKNKIAANLSAQSNRIVTIAGNCSWTFFPNFGLTINKVYISNPSSFSEPFFAIINQANVSFKLLPLLERQIKLKKLALNDAVINLIINPAGSNNWNYFSNKSLSAPSSSLNPLPPNPSPTKRKNFHIDEIKITNSKINWHDLRNNKLITVNNLNLRANPIVNNNPIDTHLTFKVVSKLLPHVLNISLSTNLTIDMTEKKYQADNLALKISREFSKTSSTLNPLVTVLTAKNLFYDANNKSLNINNYKISNDDMKSNGSFKITQLDKISQSKGSFYFESNPKALLTALGYTVLVPQVKLLSHLSLQLDFQGKGPLIQINQIQGKLDQSNLDGKANIIVAKKPQIAFQLHVDKLNCDPYLLSNWTKNPISQTNLIDGPFTPFAVLYSAVTSSIPNKENNLPASNQKEIGLHGVGTIAIDQLIIKNRMISNIKTAWDIQNHVISINPILAIVYGGNFTGNTTIFKASNNSIYNAQGNIINANIQPLLQTPFISGKGNINFNVQTTGINEVQRLQNLGGSINLQINNGEIKAIKMPELLSQVGQFIHSNKVPKILLRGKDSFSQLIINSVIKKGVLTSSKLELIASNYKAIGNGMINLINKNLSYHLTISTSHKNKKHQFLGIDFSNLNLPITITGTLFNPRIEANFSEINQNLLTSSSKKQVNNNVKHNLKLQKTLKKNLDKILN